MRRLLLLLPLFSLAITAQTRFSISGSITDENGNPLVFANVTLDRNNKYAVTDNNGRFQIQNVRRGDYIITVSTLGFQTITQSISVNSNLQLDFSLQEEVESLDDVTVFGKTEAKKQTEKAITISSLDIKQLQDLALGTEEVLKTTTGVVVRQSGGLGSELNINLNGLTGQAVRIYYDGIPLQVYGQGIRLNNIPVDALERVDVYKGVMPVEIGTDALGGGINLVPSKQSTDYLRTSYSVGSFNTHRLTFNGRKNFSERISLSTVSYLNYSDNDYRMRDIPNLTENILPDGSVGGVTEERIDARRFHNQHTSAYVEAALRIKDLSWADRLEFATSYSHRDDEIQQGRFIVNTAVGEAERKIDAIAQRIDYRKKFFNEKLNVRYYGLLSLAFDKINDSTVNVYNWLGQRLQSTNSSGAEIFARPTLREGRDLGTAHRLILNYTITDGISLTLSDFYRYTRIKGEDPIGARLTIEDQTIDPNTIPARLNRNIFGAELNADLFEKKLNAIAFYKNYDYRAESIDILQENATVLPVREIMDNTNGYGFAVKYQIHPTTFIRGSFEQAIRIPTEREVFGDFAAILPNYELRPETSNNWNVGIQFEKQFKNYKLFSLKVDGFIRNQENLIRLDQFGPENAIFINEALVDGMGVEVSSRIDPLTNLTLTGNFTYQSNEIASNGDSASGGSIGAQVPNIPQLFYNIGVNYTLNDVFKSQNDLQFFWTYLFTDRFSINEVVDLDSANPDFVIPAQNVHNAGITYNMKQKGLVFSFNLQNVFDAEIFDNFRIPRPGINYAFKINYSL